MTNLTQPSLNERLHRARTARERPHEHEVTTELARGRSARTPFVLLGGVALAVWSAVTVVAVAALLVWWLV